MPPIGLFVIIWCSKLTNNLNWKAPRLELFATQIIDAFEKLLNSYFKLALNSQTNPLKSGVKIGRSLARLRERKLNLLG